MGLMGSGKTTVGRRLAGLLERPFVDADEALEDRAGRAIAEIFATDGEDAFRDLETKVLAELLARDDAPVIASGGGVVVRQANRDLLSEVDDVLVVWLNASPGSSRAASSRRRRRPIGPCWRARSSPAPSSSASTPSVGRSTRRSPTSR